MDTSDEPEPCNASELEDEIADLERRLSKAKAWRRQLAADSRASPPPAGSHQPPSSPLRTALPSSTHFLLLLSDSALPLGSFAFSSGLESYLAHHTKTQNQSQTPNQQQPSFAAFLPLSLSSYAATALPFALAAHRDPSPARLAALDDLLDASLPCAVGRRASVAQGRALLSIWERSFAGVVDRSGSGNGNGDGIGAADALRAFAALLRSSSSSLNSAVTTTAGVSSSRRGGGHGSGRMGGAGDGEPQPETEPEPPAVAAHLAPLLGAVCALVGLSLEQTAYVFMLGHVKALVSAAVRAGMFGPYQAQKTLASGTVQGLITAVIEREWETPVEEAGQNVPVMDLWVGRHEVLYSRIFNS